MPPLSQLVVNLDRLTANITRWRQMLGPRVKLATAVKSNAYGLGGPTIAAHLQSLGVDLLIVYNTTQAIELLDAGITAPILILLPGLDLPPTPGPPGNATDHPFNNPALLAALARGQIQLGIDAPHQISAIQKLAQRLDTNPPIPVHLHLDTGMSRAGMTPEQFSQALPLLTPPNSPPSTPASTHSPAIKLAGIYTHMACTDHPTITAQQQRFDAILKQHHHLIPPDTIIHTSATHASLRDTACHRDMVRIGIGLYGYGFPSTDPLADTDPFLPGADQFQHVVRWQSQITHITHRPAGTPVGYNHLHTLTRDSLIGIIPVGYGDGYPVALSNQSHVKIGNHHAPVLGRVNMDQLIIDLTPPPPPPHPHPHPHPHTHTHIPPHIPIHVGQPVDIISDDPTSLCSVPNLANLANTHAYEIICRIQKSVPRIYTTTATAATTRT